MTLMIQATLTACYFSAQNDLHVTLWLMTRLSWLVLEKNYRMIFYQLSGKLLQDTALEPSRKLIQTWWWWWWWRWWWWNNEISVHPLLQFKNSHECANEDML